MQKKAASILDTPIEYLKGVGPLRADVLKKELSIFTYRDLLLHVPFRHIDKTKFYDIKSINTQDYVQLKASLRRVDTIGEGAKKRLVATIRDSTGVMELVWFKGIKWVEKLLVVGSEYVIYGKPTEFNGKINISHPEIETATENNTQLSNQYEPVYPSTEKLKGKGLDSKGLYRLMQQLFLQFSASDITETLPMYLLQKMRFPNKYQSYKQLHFPTTEEEYNQALNRFKFEELFYLQLKMLHGKIQHNTKVKGLVFSSIGEKFNLFYEKKLPFALTNAQKRVLKEIRKDFGSGKQMNRLLQGDVGSGKTIVALMSMLMALDNGYQTALMAPTEILAQQHYHSLSEMIKGLGIRMAFLTGSVKGKQRKEILRYLEEGEIDIVIGTHALLEESVVFKNIGLAVIDEQHRFGVVQRSKLWGKNDSHPPHILVMTATPIPRTLSMTLYGDLDVSVIDELPPGRQAIVTLHKFESGRLRVFGFIKEEIQKGRQIYIVYPLIEESEHESMSDLKNLQEGYEALSRYFPLPEYKISVVHGKMNPTDKEQEMNRFVKGETQIMIATTVIEVGVNVPNASVMVIENTERFGLAQLHQLRGRVGRGAEKSYCILMSGYKLSEDSKQRINTMCQTNNGFEIAEVDLKLRGPGNIDGLQQSGISHLRYVDLAKDQAILGTARELALRILEFDPELTREEHIMVNKELQRIKAAQTWSKIS